MDVWTGPISFPDGTEPLYDIHISTPDAHAAATPFPSNAQLSFLTLVDSSRIPLYLAAGPSFDVWSGEEDTQAWLNEFFLQEPKQREDGTTLLPWWEASRAQADEGILLRVVEGGPQRDEGVVLRRNGPRRVTELFVYGTMARDMNGREKGLPTPPGSSSPRHGSGEERQGEQEGQGSAERATGRLTVHALPLSSELLYNHSQNPGTFELGRTSEGQFLPNPYPSPEEEQRAAAALKRRRAESLLDDVAERRKKRVKRSRGLQTSTIDQQGLGRENHGATGQAAGQSVSVDDQPAKHPSNHDQQATHPSHQASREPSHGPISRRENTQQPSRTQPSTSLKPDHSIADDCHIPTATSPACLPSHEPTNKEALTKLVMAGMRLYGLQPSKRPWWARGTATSQLDTACDSQQQQQHVESNTEEYKLIYHQTFKGACFAFRRHIHHTLIKQEDMRDVVDRLLSLFCTDPLLQQNNVLARQMEGFTQASSGVGEMLALEDGGVKGVGRDVFCGGAAAAAALQIEPGDQRASGCRD
ncbi:MAG: hypothetical protein M1816_000466 [Peltula sp. TS41687]|nr:MAG: hypothetical protein M1816_000466 [Peltula sp. TS41687]